MRLRTDTDHFFFHLMLSKLALLMVILILTFGDVKTDPFLAIPVVVNAISYFMNTVMLFVYSEELLNPCPHQDS